MNHQKGKTLIRESQSLIAPSLDDEKSEVTRSRIRRAAMSVLAERGLRATMEEIARAADLSSRTVFRHFSSHDLLIADALSAMIDELGYPVDGLPDPTIDLQGWLKRLTLVAHQRNLNLGRAFWDFHNPPPDSSPVILEALAQRRVRRQAWMGYLVDCAWKTAGGTGTPPRTLIEAFSLNFSAFATNCLLVEFDDPPERAAEVTSTILLVMLTSAVGDQHL